MNKTVLKRAEPHPRWYTVLQYYRFWLGSVLLEGAGWERRDSIRADNARGKMAGACKDIGWIGDGMNEGHC